MFGWYTFGLELVISLLQLSKNETESSKYKTPQLLLLLAYEWDDYQQMDTAPPNNL